MGLVGRKGGEGGGQIRLVVDCFDLPVPLPIPNHVQPHGKKSAVHMALLLPMHRFRPLCILFIDLVASLAVMYYSIFNNSSLSMWVRWEGREERVASKRVWLLI